MPTSVDIANRALSIIGTRSTIASLDEATPEADAVSIHYEPCVKAMLRLAPWSFARKLAPAALIAAAAGTPENVNGAAPLPLVPTGTSPIAVCAWQYEYAWPQDCVRLRQVKYPVGQIGSGGDIVPLWPGAVGPPADFAATFGGGMQNRCNYQIMLDSDASGNQIKVVLTNTRNALLVYTTYVGNENLWDDEFAEAFAFMLASHLVGALIGDKQMDKDLYAKAQQAAITARAVDANEQPLSPNHTPDWIRARGWAPVTVGNPYENEYGWEGSDL